MSEPILRTCWICSRKSSKVKVLLRSFCSSSRAFFSSMVCSAFSMSESTSPMPRMREATRSGWKYSKLSSFSPLLANLMGLPVTARTESAAPPRASPSILVRITPSNCTCSWNCRATLTASWPVMASSTSRMLCGLTVLRMRTSSSMSFSSMCRRPAVSTMRTSRPFCARPLHPVLGDVHRVGLGALVVDGHAQLLAQGLELVDGRRTVDVARHHGRALALGEQELGQLAAGRGLARALQAHHHDDRRRAGREGAAWWWPTP